MILLKHDAARRVVLSRAAIFMEHKHADNLTENEAVSGFASLGISPEILSVLAELNLSTPTPIQQKAIPLAIEGNDVVGIAQTGTGKTFAFGIPMIQSLMKHKGKRGLIILPTRELAVQVNESLIKIGRKFGLKTAVLIGGSSMYHQIQDLRRGPHIVIGTPGRINDHLQQKTMHLQSVGILVLDEADHMFDMGFAPQIKKILQQAPEQRQTMLFSATMPEEILKIASTYMEKPIRVEIAKQGTTAHKIEHKLFYLKKDYKMRLLEKLLGEHPGSVLIFSRTKHGAKKICRDIRAMGFATAEIHSNKSMSQRKEALDGFKSGKYRVLVATDIASRGIDVKNIELVINFDLPEAPGDYVHRIGRTGRAGLSGKAISLVTPEQRHKVRHIERLIRTEIPVLSVPMDLPPARRSVEVKEEFSHKNNRFQRSQGRPYRKFSKRY